MEKKAEEYWLALQKAREKAEAAAKAKAEVMKLEDRFSSGLLGLADKLQGEFSICAYSAIFYLLTSLLF